MFPLILCLIIGNFELEHIPSPFIAQNFLDVEKVDSLLYFVTTRGLEIYTWHPPDPQFISRLPTDGWASGIEMYDSHAYIADGYNGLCIIDISDPTAPVQIGYYDTDGQASDVAAEDSFAYVADWANGFTIVNVSDLSGPYEVGHCPNIGHAFSVTLKDTLAYVSVFDGSLKIINVSDPSNPFIIGEFPPGPYVYTADILIEDTLAYINCGFSVGGGSTIHFAVVNIKDPANPIYIAGLEIPPTNRGIVKVGNYIYTNCQWMGVYIIDVTDPTAPNVVGIYDETDGTGYGHIIYDTFLLVNHCYEGLSIADVSDPQIPVPLYHHDNVGWKHFIVEDNLGYLYILGETQEHGPFWHTILKIADMCDPVNPVVQGELYFAGRGSVSEGSLEYPYLAVTLYRDYVNYTAVVDVSYEYAPELLRFARGGGPTELQYPHLYSLEDTLIRIANVDNPLFWVDSFSIRNVGWDIALADTIAYVTIDDSLIVLNIEAEMRIGSCYHGKPYARNISLDFPYLAVPYTPYPGSTYGFLIFDVSNPSAPELLFDELIYEPPLTYQALCIVGCELKDTLLYFCRRGHGFDIWKIEYPDSTYRIVNHETPDAAQYIHANNSTIFVLDDWSLELYRVIGPGVEDRLVDTRFCPLILEVFPNPFRTKTNIRYQIPDMRYKEGLELKIYDISGRLIKSFLLSNFDFPLSPYVEWDGTDNIGNKLSQGIYFVTLKTGSDCYTEKVILLK
ncbi:MAG: T9SS type A sorting domain-containing protein [candidate division WOR-3 bacterium]|nr:MAG: T9SS type A sorting domain-containing protein [candidate division WOR-3 bacterium]